MDGSFITESWELFYFGIFKLTKVLTRVVKKMALLGLLKLHTDWEARSSACKCSCHHFPSAGQLAQYPDIKG